MPEQMTGSGEQQSQSLLEKTDELLVFDKGTFVYLEFDTQATEPDKALSIYENTFRFTIPMNYIPVLVNIVSVDESNNVVDYFPIEKLTYDGMPTPDGCLVVAKPPEGFSIDMSNHWIAYVVCIGIDTTKMVIGLESVNGTIEEKSGFYIIKYADNNGTDTITLRYDDTSTETITVDKSNLWTVRPAVE